MNTSEENKDQDEKICKLCNQQPSKYTCPKCDIVYCSLNCYKSQDHLECSESFYKQCVEDELSTIECDDDSRKKMVDILQRMHKQMEEDVIEDILRDDTDDDDQLSSDKDNQLDSDDERAAPDLEERLKNVNLDDPNAVWSALTDAEKQEFEASVRSGDVENLVPTWEPWWTFHKKEKLVEELNECEDKSDYLQNCPKIISVAKFNELVKASPYIQYNIQNVLYAYVYTILYFNGEHQNSAEDAAHVFFDICDNMHNNKIFDNAKSAADAVLERLTTSTALPGNEQTLETLKENVHMILNGPEKKNKLFYVSTALSDLYILLKKAKRQMFLTESTLPQFKKRFPRKFSQTSELAKRTQITKKELQLCLKKLEYYLSWVNCYGYNMYCQTEDY